MSRIVLASGSPRRRVLLEALGIEVEVRTSGVDEVSDGAPEAVVLANARAKCAAVASPLDDEALVIAADTEVVLDAGVFGKPKDLDQAREMLRSLSGRTHEVYTGVAVRDTGSGRSAEGAECTRVHFRELSEEEIEVFVSAVEPLDRAGAYTVDGPGSLLIGGYEGCYLNVLGLPMALLDNLLKSLGHSLFGLVDGERSRFL